MKVETHPTNPHYVLFRPETTDDVTVMDKFPALTRHEMIWYGPRKQHILFNVLSRLKAKLSLNIAPDIQQLMDNPIKIKDLREDFKFYTEPKPFQRIALRFMNHFMAGGLLLEPGMGKTKIVQDFIAYNKMKKSMIVCPKPLLAVWMQEARIHRPDLRFYKVETTDWEKEKEGILAADVVVVNYNKAVIFCEIGEFCDIPWDFIGLDEALIKDHTSQRTVALTKLAKKIPNRCLMSGTLINNSCLDVYAPMRFLDVSLVGDSYYKFAEEYSNKVVMKTGPESSITTFKGTKYPHLLKDILRSNSIVMTKDEWLNLPPKNFYTHFVQLDDVAREIYFKFASNWCYYFDDGTFVEADIALTSLAKLTQISNGFVYLSKEAEEESEADMGLMISRKKSDKPKKKKATKRGLEDIRFFGKYPKAEKMIDLLKGGLKSRRVMIWYNLQAELKIILDALEAEGITYLTAVGGDKNINRNIDLFNSDPKYRCLVSQAKTINYGVTVLGKDYDEEADDIPIGITPEVFTQIFYSFNFSLEVFIQQQDRIHRLGQEFPCDYHFLVANTPTERKIMKAMEDKQEIREYMLEDSLEDIRKQAAKELLN